MTVNAGQADSEAESSKAVHPTKVTRTWFPTNRREQLGERVYNAFITFFPSHRVRIAALRLIGAEIGPATVIRLGVRILGIQQLRFGSGCVVGTRAVIDARGEIVIGDGVVVERDVQLISGQHVVNSDDFGQLDAPIYIDSGAFIEFRSMIVQGVHIGVGSVVTAGSLVRGDVKAGSIVSGVPAVECGTRDFATDSWAKSLLN